MLAKQIQDIGLRLRTRLAKTVRVCCDAPTATFTSAVFRTGASSFGSELFLHCFTFRKLLRS